MSENWTKGPWHVCDVEGHPADVRIGTDAKLIAVFGNASAWVDNRQEWTANATLAASAPDLHEALAEARLQIVYLHEKFKETGTGNSVLAKIDAALSRARGET